MKKLAALLFSLLLFGCSSSDKSHNMQITNLTGITWYNAQVWYRSSPEGEVIDYHRIGLVPARNSFTVDAHYRYFYIYAEDYEGNMIMSVTKQVQNEVTIAQEDIY